MAKKTTNLEFNEVDPLTKTMVLKNGNGSVKVYLNNKQIFEKMLEESNINRKSLSIKCKNKKQKDFIKMVDNNQINIAIGCAGVGKSYLSVIKAFNLLMSPENNYQYIYLVTPAVEAEEKLGFLPGDVIDKLEPYLYSTYYLIDKLIGEKNRKRLIEAGIIKPVALAYIRGANIDNSILLFEEAQNSTPKQMKTLLTRIGFNSKFIITGDLEQSDRYRDTKESGLYQVLNLLRNMEDVGIYEWVIDNPEDVVRNPIIGNILDRYNKKED